MSHKLTRRDVLASSVVGTTALLGLEEKILLAALQQGEKSQAEKTKLPKGKMPTGKLGKLTISRLIMGGNLIGGWAHARDLIYVSELFKTYNTKEKIFETLAMAEKLGVNSIVISSQQLPIINKYNKDTGGKVQTIASVQPQEFDPLAGIDKAIDKGASTIYLHGATCDSLVKKGRIEVIEKALEYIKSKGLPAGVGAHSVYVLIECREQGIVPDYWVKTLHHDKYWSAHPKENREPFTVDHKQSDKHDEIHDNMFCLEPEKTIEFMKNEDKPWIAFKTLAAGAISPKDGFKYAFENGADFITVGMFDFQLKQDSAIACAILNKTKERIRPWLG